MKQPDWLRGINRYFLFTIIFYSLWPVAKILGAANFELTSFPARMIGEATYEGLDVSARIWIFYKCVGAFILTALVLVFVARFIVQKVKVLPVEVILFNHISLAGIGFYVFKLFDMNIGSGKDLVYYLHKAAIVAILAQLLFFRNKQALRKHALTLFVSGLFTGLALYVGIAQWNFVLSHEHLSHNIFNFFIYGIIIVYGLAALRIKNESMRQTEQGLVALLRMLLPLMVLFLFPVLIDEVYLYFNNHYIFAVTPLKLMSVYTLFIIAWITFVYFKPQTQNTSTPLTYVATRYLPLALAGIAAILYYNPFMGPSNEMFEVANRMLPVSEFFRFGVFPFVEKFNSHLLSETFFGFIYTFLYVIKSQEMAIYDFMYPVLHLVICGTFMFYYTRNLLATLFIVLILPAFPAIVPEYFSVTLLTVFVLQRYLSNPDTLKNYLLLFGWMAFMVLWRIDLGYPLIVAALFVIVVYRAFLFRSHFNLKLLIRSGLLFFGSLFLVLLIISWIRGFNLFTALSNELGYLSSSQSYGTKTLGQTWIKEFKYHHYFFPFAVVIIAGAILLKFKQFNVSRQQRFVSMSLLFMIVFYLVNFQRGLVRHGFAENVDMFMSSHVFLIICGSAYLFLRHRSQVQRLLVFASFALVSMLYLKFPAVANPSFMVNDALHKMQHRPLLQPVNRYIVRCNEDDYFKFATYEGFKQFSDKHLRSGETFGDFSNTPMLYHYAQRECPGYFPQNVLSVHNDRLQDEAIKKMKQYNIPYVVMNHLYDNWWDRTDGVENTIRHYRLAEYFYKNYEPAIIIQNNYVVWKRIGMQMELNQADTLIHHVGKIELNEDSVSCRYRLPDIIQVRSGKKYVIHLTYVKDKEFHDPVVHGYSRKHERDAFRLWPSGNNRYTREAWYVYEPFDSRTMQFSIEHPEKVSSFTLVEYDYVPDMVSRLPKSINIQRLGYIWGNYDRKIDTLQKLFIHQSKKDILGETKKIKIRIPSDIDKSTGNYAWFKFYHLQENDETDLRISYGSDSTVYGSFTFKVPGNKKKKKLPFVAIRLSSQYNWMIQRNNWIELEYLTPNKKQLLVEEFAIIKGD